jgi:hypothetical protein
VEFVIKSKWLARSTVFAIAILAVGSVALLRGVMSGHDYVELATVIHAFIIGRAIAEDYHERNLPEQKG